MTSLSSIEIQADYFVCISCRHRVQPDPALTNCALCGGRLGAMFLSNLPDPVAEPTETRKPRFGTETERRMADMDGRICRQSP